MNVASTRAAIDRSHLQDGIRELCVELIDIVCELHDGDGEFLPVSFFMQRITERPPTEVVSALNYLSSIETPLLCLHGYIEDDGEPLVIDDDEFRSFLKDGTLIHPNKGVAMADPADRLHLFYSLCTTEVAHRSE